MQKGEFVVTTEQVWKTFGSTTAVRGLNLSVPARSVYGFLGPNGAGKSTTIRMILGLQRPDRGKICVFGKPLQTSLLARIGSLVESPSLYPHLTGRENLEVHRRLLGVSKSAIGEALATVDLSAAADRVVKGYSTGMKQRLGMAQALLGNPELLFLDEPTNGLDPAGIHEVRSLIRDLPDRRGVTVFLSSHLLAEVEQVATHFSIISAGQSRFEGTADELRVRGKPVIVVEIDDGIRALAILDDAGIKATLESENVLNIQQGEPAQINTILVREGVAVSHLSSKYPTLEDVFLKLTCPETQEAVTNDA